MWGSRRKSASAWDMSLLLPTPPFSRGLDVNWIARTQLLKQVYGSLPQTVMVFTASKQEEMNSQTYWSARGSALGWIGVTFWEKGTPTTCDTSTRTVASSLQPRSCRCCLGFRGGPRLLLRPSPARAQGSGLVLEAASPPVRGAPQPRLLWLARLRGLPEAHSGSKNTAPIRQQLCKTFLSSSA